MPWKEVSVMDERLRFVARVLEGEAAHGLVGRVALLELSPRVLARALDAFPGPAPLRTLDAMHLASCAYLADQGQDVELASYDRRMNDAARAMNIPLFGREES